ncbi:MAG: peptidoglycan editing factor PgeF [Hyphomicrobiaceae bacterium]
MTNAITATCLSGLRGIRHGFFTREGGVSEGVYTSLNCGPGSRDEPGKVRENRRRVGQSLGVDDADHVLTLYQIHSAIAVPVDRPTPREMLPRADALVTATPGLVIGVLTADCTPVLFADPVAKVAGAAHAGWRGALTGVLEATIEGMEALGAQRNRIASAIGPTISQEAYEVGPEFEAEFLTASPLSARFFQRTDAESRPHFDLPGYVEARLSAAGIGTVERKSLCTSGNDSLFFSYRRMRRRGEPDYGRQISAIVVT